jgi:hypothetical protein
MGERVRGGRLQLDKTGMRARTGAAASTIDHWHHHRDTTGFPPPADTDPDGKLWWWADDIDAFTGTHRAALARRFTTIDRTGDPHDLLTPPQAAPVLGYKDHRSIPKALRARPDHVERLPSGRLRRRWYRHTLWAYADARPHRRSYPHR